MLAILGLSLSTVDCRFTLATAFASIAHNQSALLFTSIVIKIFRILDSVRRAPSIGGLQFVRAGCTPKRQIIIAFVHSKMSVLIASTPVDANVERGLKRE